MQTLSIFVLLLLSGPCWAASSAETDALLSIFNATQGWNWNQNAYWNFTTGSTDPCDGPWYGVVCDSSGDVIELYIPANNLNGSLPEVFGNLTHLQTLSMQENPLLGGFLPTSLYLAPDLEFVALFSCDFSGPIPVEAFQRPQLKSLQLGYNRLSGELSSNVDSWNASSLQLLSVPQNALTGNTTLLFYLPALRYMDASDNFITGPLFPFFQNTSAIQLLNLAGNQIQGPIPAEMGELPNLNYLSLIDCNCSGPLPKWMSQNSSFTVNVTGNENLWCPLPEWCMEESSCDVCNPETLQIEMLLNVTELYVNNATAEAEQLVCHMANVTQEQWPPMNELTEVLYNISMHWCYNLGHGLTLLGGRMNSVLLTTWSTWFHKFEQLLPRIQSLGHMLNEILQNLHNAGVIESILKKVLAQDQQDLAFIDDGIAQAQALYNTELALIDATAYEIAQVYGETRDAFDEAYLGIVKKIQGINQQISSLSSSEFLSEMGGVIKAGIGLIEMCYGMPLATTSSGKSVQPYLKKIGKAVVGAVKKVMKDASQIQQLQQDVKELEGSVEVLANLEQQLGVICSLIPAFNQSATLAEILPSLYICELHVQAAENYLEYWSALLAKTTPRTVSAEVATADFLSYTQDYLRLLYNAAQTSMKIQVLDDQKTIMVNQTQTVQGWLDEEYERELALRQTAYVVLQRLIMAQVLAVELFGTEEKQLFFSVLEPEVFVSVPPLRPLNSYEVFSKLQAEVSSKVTQLRDHKISARNRCKANFTMSNATTPSFFSRLHSEGIATFVIHMPSKDNTTLFDVRALSASVNCFNANGSVVPTLTTQVFTNGMTRFYSKTGEVHSFTYRPFQLPLQDPRNEAEIIPGAYGSWTLFVEARNVKDIVKVSLQYSLLYYDAPFGGQPRVWGDVFCST